MKMSKTLKSGIVIIAVLSMLLVVFAGCGKPAASQSASGSPASSAPAPAPATDAPGAEPETVTDAPAEEKTGVSYPIEGDVELSYFYILDTSYGFEPDDMTLFQQLEERTGVHMNLTYAPGQGYGTELNIMVAGGELPDLIRNAANQFPEGLDWAVEQDIIVPLNDYLEDYMPDYYKTISENSDYWNSIVTSNGTIGAANGLYYEPFGPQSGFVIRQDWLDELSLDSPETIDQWHETLTAFKTEGGCEYPLWLSSAGAYTGDFFGSAFDTATMVATGKYPMYNVDGTVHFGPVEEGYKSYLELMSAWYSEGLISPDFSSAQGYMFPLPPGDPATGKYGIWCTMLGMYDQYSHMTDDDSFQIVPLTDPVLTEGQVTHLGFDIDYVCQGSVSVTSSCENVEAACMWINYGYTEDGILLNNFGVEDEGFTYNSAGEPEFTELVTHNPDGMTPTAAMFRYAGGDNSPTVINFRSGWSAYSEGAKSAMEMWGNVSDGAYELPKNCALTSEEKQEFNTIYVDIETYIAESVLRFVTGEMAISEYDAFVETIKTMNIDRCIEIYQGALTRALAA